MNRRFGFVVAAALAVALPSTAAAQTATSDSEPPRATLYAFFATWCVPCRVELPHIEQLHLDFRDRGLKVVLVSQDAPSTAPNIPSFLARYRVTADWVLDSESALLERYNPSTSLPFTALVGTDGRLLYAHSGYEPGDERLVRAAIEKHLGPVAPSAARYQASASSQTVGVYRTSKFEPNPDNDGVLSAGVERLELSGRAPGFASASVRIDGAIVDDDVTGRHDDARVERATLRVPLGRFELVAGDSYAQFGTGMALSLRKVDSLGVDTSLRGGRVDYSGDAVKATVLAGVTNPQNLDPLALRIVDEDGDRIGGAEVTVRAADGVLVGPYVVAAQADDGAADGSDNEWWIGGIASSIERGELRIRTDGALGRRVDIQSQAAWALYASASLTKSKWSALVEGKSYRHWSFGRTNRALAYHEPPTLEREDQEVPSNEDALGGRTRIERRFGDSTSAFANALLYFASAEGKAPIGEEIVVHGYAGAEHRLASGAAGALQAGYRHERFADGGRKLELWHVDVDGAIELGRELALTIKWNHREETKVAFDDIDFRRGLAVLGLSRSGLGAVSLLYGYSTESATAPTHYPGAELSVHLPRGGTARLFVGSLTGGRVCVSGSCRDVPPFRGARLDLVLRL